MIRRLVKPTPTIAKINVTPIIDVALVLVIILLITAPMLAVADLDVDLPVARTQSLSQELRVNITLSRERTVGIDDRLVPYDDVEGVLLAHREAHPGEDLLVVLRADAAVPHHAVQELLQKARRAGISRLAIATRRGSGGTP